MDLALIIVGGIVIVSLLGVLPNIISTLRQGKTAAVSDQKVAELEKRLETLEKANAELLEHQRALEEDSHFMRRLLEGRQPQS